MAMDLLSYREKEDQLAIEEAAKASLRLSSPPSSTKTLPLDYHEITQQTVSQLKKMISTLDRIGHARFRRAPTFAGAPAPVPAPAAAPHSFTIDFTKQKADFVKFEKDNFSVSAATTSNSTSFISNVTGDGSVTGKPGTGILFPGDGSVNGKYSSGVLFPAGAGVSSSGKPPLSSSMQKKRKCIAGVDGKHIAVNGGSCHCSKKNKSKVKKTIRVPAISSRIADIPQDEYSWRKYGQKPIKGSPYPRVYYKCSIVRGCPARKHLERDVDEPAMLIVTYINEHRHVGNTVTPSKDTVML